MSSGIGLATRDRNDGGLRDLVAVLMEEKLVGVLLAALFGSLAAGRLGFGFEDTELAVASKKALRCGPP